MKIPEELKTRAIDYQNNAWKDYTPEEYAMWVHLFAKRAGHRNPNSVEKIQKDLYDANNYWNMLGSYVEAHPHDLEAEKLYDKVGIELAIAQLKNIPVDPNEIIINHNDELAAEIQEQYTVGYKETIYNNAKVGVLGVVDTLEEAKELAASHMEAVLEDIMGEYDEEDEEKPSMTFKGWNEYKGLYEWDAYYTDEGGYGYQYIINEFEKTKTV